MKVYVVYQIETQSKNILGVYSTRKIAEEARCVFKRKEDYLNIFIEEIEYGV